MNFLAHSFLSYSKEQLVGNMIADFIKNRDLPSFPKKVQDGIKLHRSIDSFTDAHPIIHEAKVVFQPLVRLYSGAFVDVTFDYFLANIKNEKEWKEHSKYVYSTLWEFEEWLPEIFKPVLEKMEKDDWLGNYRYDWGIKYGIQNVLNRAKYLEKNIDVFSVFLNNKPFLQEKYNLFFPLLEHHSFNFSVI